MPAHLSVATIIEANRIHSDVAFLVALEIDVIDPVTGGLVDIMRLVRNGENVTFNGHEFVSASFDIELESAAGEVPQIQLSAVDYSQAIQAKMQQFGGGIGFEVRVIVINAGALDQPPEMVERFKVVKASAKNYVVTFTLGAENPLTLRFPRRLQFRDRCPWRFKSAECGYTGPASSCDYTLQGDSGCSDKGNQANFGGFPGLMLRNG
jgi:hypothetical protein